MHVRFALMIFFQARDLLSIYSKLVQVLYPRRTGSGREVLRYYSRTRMTFSVINIFHVPCRDWDLWGPLVLCLLLGIMLSVNVCEQFAFYTVTTSTALQAPPAQSLGVFTGVVVIVSVGSLVVTIQAKVCFIFHMTPTVADVISKLLGGRV